MDEDFEVSESDHELVHELYEIWDKLNQSRMLEAWHDAQQIREEALDLFSHGIVDLKTRAQIERLYWSVTREISQIASGLKHAPDEFRKLDKLLADKYFCNFSLFQSLPDSWAIDQIFPIMPIQRLDERPDRTATLQDITCDSDGKIANFISTRNVSHDLPVHSLKGKDAYYIGVFLVGAYQEILGDMHNLFGDTNAVHVTVDEKGYNIEQVIDGETVAEVLDYVQYNPKKHLPQNFPNSPHPKKNDIISIFSFQRMYRQIMGNIACRNKVGNLAIRVAGYVLQSRRPVRTFIQPLDRHDRENLIDRPRVRQGLEKREITEILISQ